MVSGHMIGGPTRVTCPNPCPNPHPHPSPLTLAPHPHPGPSQVTNPIGRKACPEVAKDMAAILKPAYRFGPAPKYTKVQRATGCG